MYRKAVANSYEKDQIYKETQYLTKGIMLLSRVALVVFIFCVIGIVVTLWVTDSYKGHVLMKPLSENQSQRTHYQQAQNSTVTSNTLGFRDESTWLRVQFYAVGHEHDNATTVQPDNSSAFDTEDTCIVPRLDESKPPAHITCKRPKPIQGSCDIANATFHAEPTPTCNHQKHYDICRIKSTTDSHRVDCNNKLCRNNIALGTINRAIGYIQWAVKKNIGILESAIRNILTKDERSGNFGFCFIKCTLQNKNTVVSQLLLLPKNFSQIRCKDGDSCRDSININVIWLDSTSHSHFYRSMPKSVEAFRRIKSNKDAYVFNYNLMQSMRGGTYVNTYAFTSGAIKGRQYLLKKRVPIGDLFYMFKRGGHHVTWIDDLCWRWSLDKCACGIPKFLGLAPNRQKSYTPVWKNLLKTMYRKGVEQIDISMANCEIMKANGITDPFKSKKDSVAICYNRQYQTDYILSAMELLQRQLNLVNRPFFHYLDLNLGHEASGRRIQTLDTSFAKLITYIGRQNNTFTLIFGDHGNKYGTFVKATKESKIEMAHTVLFALVSRDLKDKLGVDKINALDINQDRMVNIMDLRHTLLTLVPNISVKSLVVDKKFDTHPNGLFHPISPSRSCKSMGISLEAGKCICEEGIVNLGVRNDTKVTVMADFALGLINNKIQDQFMTANGDVGMGFGLCQRLVGKWISAVQETVTETLTIVEMNLHVPAGTSVPQSEDVFSVVIHISKQANSNATLMKLDHYERISTYAVYDKCRDEGVDGDLCICSLSQAYVMNGTWRRTWRYWHEIPQVVFGHPATVLSFNHCLFLFERRTPYGLVLETSCDCSNKTYIMQLVIVNQVNVVDNSLQPKVAEVHSGMMLFVAAFHQLDPLRTWALDYVVQFKEM